ncbi:MAG: aminotransferase class V-fold PLP-dependent enzyme [Lachnospiraceae bacterium]|nr:aminotransferase class V-fold PLP-dependent enzyme [Lachnospiraceae bacterium]
MEFSTRLLHGMANSYPNGATLPPISQVSAFSYESSEALEKVFQNRAPGYAYTRIGNPTVDAFERRICELEGGVGAVACSSGMAAVTLSLLNILQAGDEVIAASGLFGGTIDLFGDLESFGITTRFVHHVTVQEVEPLINERTKVIFGEMIGNPALDVMDVRSVAELAHAKGIPLVVDATTATPYLIRPFEYGADIVVHSSSKYINGGGNSISGIIVDGGRFKWDAGRYPGMKNYISYGPFAYIAKLRNGIWRNMGACLAPMNAFLNVVGLETLGLRMERICQNARALAEAIAQLACEQAHGQTHRQTCEQVHGQTHGQNHEQAHGQACEQAHEQGGQSEPGRSRGLSVNYPTLQESPYHALAESQLGGKGGAILTIRVGSKENAYQVMDSLKYAKKATNIGDIRTLVIHPASTIYVHASREQKAAAGVYDDLIRISVGIEDTGDLVEDFTNAILAVIRQ